MAQPELTKPLPHDDYIERTVLGAILAQHPQASELLDNLQAQDFFDSRNRKIFMEMQALRQGGRQPGLLNVHDALTLSGNLGAAGDIAYVASLPDGVHGGGDLLSGACALRRMTALRAIVHCADQLQESALAQAGTAEQLLDASIGTLSELARELESVEGDGTSYFDAATRKLTELREGPRLKIYTDIDKLDSLTGGFRECELVVLTAETGAGKSLGAAQIRARACRDGFRALFCSGEMNAAHLVGRELAPAAHIPPVIMRREDLLNDEDFAALVEAA